MTREDYAKNSKEELLDIVMEMDDELADKDTEIAVLSNGLRLANDRINELEEILADKRGFDIR